MSREATIGALDGIKTMTLMPRVLRQVTGDLPPVIHSVVVGHIKSEAVTWILIPFFAISSTMLPPHSVQTFVLKSIPMSCRRRQRQSTAMTLHVVIELAIFWKPQSNWKYGQNFLPVDAGHPSRERFTSRHRTQPHYTRNWMQKKSPGDFWAASAAVVKGEGSPIWKALEWMGARGGNNRQRSCGAEVNWSRDNEDGKLAVCSETMKWLQLFSKPGLFFFISSWHGCGSWKGVGKKDCLASREFRVWQNHY